MEEHGLARRTDPSTSHEAAAVVNVNHLEICALIALFSVPLGFTCSEIAVKANYPRDSISPRMRRLLEKGMVTTYGIKRIPYLPNPENKRQPRQLVWEITEKGRAIVKDFYAKKSATPT